MDAPAEQDLIAAVKAGDEVARNQLVLAFQAFAEREARRRPPARPLLAGFR